MNHQADYEGLAARLDAQGIDVEAVKRRLKAQHIETPSWGYGNSGTRFKVYSWPGAARNIHEKLADAGYVQRLTGVAPTVALQLSHTGSEKPIRLRPGRSWVSIVRNLRDVTLSGHLTDVIALAETAPARG